MNCNDVVVYLSCQHLVIDASCFKNSKVKGGKQSSTAY